MRSFQRAVKLHESMVLVADSCCSWSHADVLVLMWMDAVPCIPEQSLMVWVLA